jgi:hypothetical protein
MKQFILDTNILIKDPGIITRWSPNYQIIIPRFLFGELNKVVSRLGQIGNFWKTLDQAIKSGFAIVYEDEVIFSEDLYQRGQNLRLSTTDLMLFELTSQLVKKNQDAILITNDRGLRVFTEEAGYKTFDLFQFQSFVLSFKTTGIEQLKENETIKQYQNKKFLYGAISGILVTIIALLIKKNFDYIYSTINIWGTLCLILALGITFFLLRTNFRFEYGILEFGFGFYVSTRIFFDKDFNYELISTLEIAQVLTGIYVMVRGLSNIDDGISGRTFEPTWKKITRWRKNNSR